MSNRQGGTVAGEAIDTSVRKAVTVEVDRERAFTVFTEEFDTWWNRSHHIGEAELEAAIIEPREGGRWYERGVDGSECDWGRVLVWEPPARLVLAWQLTSEWKYDPDFLTEIEVTFTAESASRTRVELEHRNLDRFGAAMVDIRATFESDGGWTGLLQLYADRASAG
jgi:uncharacterized protein YndB with AHSA1/START domain